MVICCALVQPRPCFALRFSKVNFSDLFYISFLLFQSHPDPLESGNWLTVTEGVVGKYCQQTNPGLVLGNQPNDKIVITKDLALKPNDVIQFRVGHAGQKLPMIAKPIYLYTHY